ncbi:MAG: formylglycine-generating enzyme family protein [Campylobacteraceae bacterium]|nr:formylglycine-generating enzyme family protein [Campylobacteraceae bacterium]
MSRYLWLLVAFAFIIGGCSGKEDKKLSKTYTNSIGMDFVLVDAGTFTMGSDKNANEKPAHNVTISKSFYLSATEVTQEQWEKVLGHNPGKFKAAKNPVESVSWHNVRFFISKLNAIENTNRYRLPTEAEWEYAAAEDFEDVSKLKKHAWYYESTKTKSLHPNAVAQKSPNKWGLYDMHGNVWEWVEDKYNENFYSKSPKKDPLNNLVGDKNVLKGGSCYNSAEFLRPAARISQPPDYKGDDVGFRVLLAVE